MTFIQERQHNELPEFSTSAAERLKEKVKAKLANRAWGAGQKEVLPKPRYDQIFADGVAWLDSM